MPRGLRSAEEISASGESVRRRSPILGGFRGSLREFTNADVLGCMRGKRDAVTAGGKAVGIGVKHRNWGWVREDFAVSFCAAFSEAFFEGARSAPFVTGTGFLEGKVSREERGREVGCGQGVLR